MCIYIYFILLQTNKRYYNSLRVRTQRNIVVGAREKEISSGPSSVSGLKVKQTNKHIVTFTIKNSIDYSY